MAARLMPYGPLLPVGPAGREPHYHEWTALERAFAAALADHTAARLAWRRGRASAFDVLLTRTALRAAALSLDVVCGLVTPGEAEDAWREDAAAGLILGP